MYQYQINSILPSRNLDRFGTITKAFSDEEIDRILFFEKILNFSPAKIGIGDGDINPAVRLSETAFFHVDENTKWLWEKIAVYASTVNYDLFLYDVEGIQTLQFTRYNGSDSVEESGHYSWHCDAEVNAYKKYDRKISGILMLSDKDEYVGGEFQVDLRANFNPMIINLDKGDIFVFDSQRTHRVTPVTSGVRKTLVFWIVGKSQL